jgi:hypothetical protein
MSPQVSVEERLEVVEEAIVALREQLAISQPTNWLDRVTGSFKDEPAFDEVLAYGREIRAENHTFDSI